MLTRHACKQETKVSVIDLTLNELHSEGEKGIHGCIIGNVIFCFVFPDYVIHAFLKMLKEDVFEEVLISVNKLVA